MEAWAERLGLRTDPTIFFVSAGLTVVFVLLLVVVPEPIGGFFEVTRAWIVTNLGWFFIIGVNAWLGFLIWAAVSRHGHIKLGPRDSTPDYSNLSWFTMLFAGGIGTVLMFWGVAEPISHFSSPPLAGVEPFTEQAARTPSRYRSIIWGCTPGRSLLCRGWRSAISSIAITFRCGSARYFILCSRRAFMAP